MAPFKQILHGLAALSALFLFNNIAEANNGKKMNNEIWEGAKVYVYGSAVIDLNQNFEQWIPAHRTRVKDCSNEKYYCIRPTIENLGLFNFVLPIKCQEFNIGDKFELNGIVTEIISSANLHMSDYKYFNIYYFISNNKKEFIFEYSPLSGITAIYWDHDRDINKMNRHLESGRLTARNFGFLSTFDRFANCKR